MAAARWTVEKFAGLPWPELVQHHQVSGNNSRVQVTWGRRMSRSSEGVRASGAHSMARWHTACKTRYVCWEGCKKWPRGTSKPRLMGGYAERARAPLPAWGLEGAGVHISRIMHCRSLGLEQAVRSLSDSAFSAHSWWYSYMHEPCNRSKEKQSSASWNQEKKPTSPWNALPLPKLTVNDKLLKSPVYYCGASTEERSQSSEAINW